MTPPPTNIDGSDITGATIDGQEVQEITVDGQTVFTVAQPVQIPSSAEEQWIATAYNGDWIGQINGFDLTGGSATQTTGPDGNTVVRYNGTSGQGHANTSLNVGYNRAVLAMVFRLNVAGDGNVIFGSGGTKEVLLQNESGPTFDLQWNKPNISGGTPDTNLHLMIAYAPNFLSDDELEIDGNTVATGAAGNEAFETGFTLGDRSAQDVPISADILECLIYRNPSASDISSERSRLQSTYGL
jgi:hypothetical protein